MAFVNTSEEPSRPFVSVVCNNRLDTIKGLFAFRHKSPERYFFCQLDIPHTLYLANRKRSRTEAMVIFF